MQYSTYTATLYIEVVGRFCVCREGNRPFRSKENKAVSGGGGTDSFLLHLNQGLTRTLVHTDKGLGRKKKKHVEIFF